MVDLFEENGISLPCFDEVMDDENPMIVAHFTHHSGAEWWIISGEEQLLYDNTKSFLLYGMAKITHEELGVIVLDDILGVGAVLDTDWVGKRLREVFPLN